MTKYSASPIGVFDSGVGGISVLAELASVLPHEDFIYLGDSKNAPYGSKTHNEVLELSIRNTEFLLEKGAKAIVVACNTATGVAAEELRKKYPNIPVIGIEPAVKPAVSAGICQTVVVMATPVTLKEEKFARLAKHFENDANIIPLPCPKLAELVEKGNMESDEIYEYLKKLFEPFENKKIDSLVLGCTHYPFVKEAIKKTFPGSVKIFDGGHGTACETKRRLSEFSLLNKPTHNGSVCFLNSLNTREEIELSEKLFASYLGTIANFRQKGGQKDIIG